VLASIRGGEVKTTRVAVPLGHDAVVIVWLSNSPGAVKVTVDLAIGETSKIETEDKDKIKDIVDNQPDEASVSGVKQILCWPASAAEK
jgi:hypothetical protein